jgi:hypothetical protein
MKIIKTALHYWIAIVSVLSFLVGWGMLAHSLKPVQPSQSSTLNNVSLPALPPIQAFGSGGGSGGGGRNFLPPSNQSNSGFPILRSGGS